MGQFSINGTFTYLPDPSSYAPDQIVEVGSFTDGAPILQGKESGTLTWDILTPTQYKELYDAWNTNKGNLVSGTLPERSATSLATYDSVTAYYHEPVGRASVANWHNVTMAVTYVSR